MKFLPFISLLQLVGAGQPGLMVTHVHVNQVSPKRWLLIRRYNEPPQPLQLWWVIAIHSPEAHLYSINRDPRWMARAACSGQTYSNLHIVKWASLLFSRVSFPDKSNRRTSNYICDGIMLAERRAPSSLHESKPLSKHSGKKRPGGLSMRESSQVHSYIILHTSAGSLQLYLADVTELGSPANLSCTVC